MTTPVSFSRNSSLDTPLLNLPPKTYFKTNHTQKHAVLEQYSLPLTHGRVTTENIHTVSRFSSRDHDGNAFGSIDSPETDVAFNETLSLSRDNRKNLHHSQQENTQLYHDYSVLRLGQQNNEISTPLLFSMRNHTLKDNDSNKSPALLVREIERLRAHQTLLENRLSRLQAAATAEKSLTNHIERQNEENRSLATALRARLAEREAEISMLSLENSQNAQFKRLYETVCGEKAAIASSLEQLGQSLLEADLQDQIRNKKESLTRMKQDKASQQKISTLETTIIGLKQDKASLEEKVTDAMETITKLQSNVSDLKTNQLEADKRAERTQQEALHTKLLVQNARQAVAAIMSAVQGQSDSNDPQSVENESAITDDYSVLTKDLADLRIALQLVREEKNLDKNQALHQLLSLHPRQNPSTGSSTLSIDTDAGTLRQRLQFALEEVHDERKLRTIQENQCTELKRTLAQTEREKDRLTIELNELKALGVQVPGSMSVSVKVPSQHQNQNQSPSQNQSPITSLLEPKDLLLSDSLDDLDLFDLPSDDALISVLPTPVEIFAPKLRDSVLKPHRQVKGALFQPYDTTVIAIRIQQAVLNTNYAPFASPNVQTICSFQFWDCEPISSQTTFGVAPFYNTSGQFTIDVDEELESYLSQASVSLVLFSTHGGTTSEPVAIGKIKLNELFSDPMSYIEALPFSTSQVVSGQNQSRRFTKNLTLFSPVTGQVVASVKYSIGTLHPIFLSKSIDSVFISKLLNITKETRQNREIKEFQPQHDNHSLSSIVDSTSLHRETEAQTNILDSSKSNSDNSNNSNSNILSPSPSHRFSEMLLGLQSLGLTSISMSGVRKNPYLLLRLDIIARNIQSFMPDVVLSNGCLAKLSFQAKYTFPSGHTHHDSSFVALSSPLISKSPNNALSKNRFTLEFQIPIDNLQSTSMEDHFLEISVFAPTNVHPEYQLGCFTLPLFSLFQSKQGIVNTNISSSHDTDTYSLIEQLLCRTTNLNEQPSLPPSLGSAGAAGSTGSEMVTVFGQETPITSVMLSSGIGLKKQSHAFKDDCTGMMSFSTIALALYFQSPNE